MLQRVQHVRLPGRRRPVELFDDIEFSEPDPARQGSRGGFGWFFGNAMTTMVFTKASTFSVGANVQAGENRTVAEPFIAGFVGSVHHADWLGLPRKGAFSLFSVSPGAMSLASWFDGEKKIPVTGGSISGSVQEFTSAMRRS